MKPLSRYLILLVTVAAGFSHLSAQPRCKIEHYSTEDGLSHDMVTYMYKDSEGFMWFGTWNGLNRFDGKQFLTFKSTPGDYSYIMNDRIDQITEDDHKHLWLKSYDGQIYRFNKKTERFQPTLRLLKQPPAIGAFKGILSRYDDKLWMETVGKGVLVLENPASDTSSWKLYSAEAEKGYKIPSNKILFLKEDSKGQVWLGTDKGLCRLGKNRAGIYESSPVRFADDTVAVTCFSENTGAVYAGTSDGRLLVFSGTGQLLTALKIGQSPLNALLVSGNQQYLYVTTASGTLARINRQNFAVTLFTQAYSTSLSALYEDRRGDLWIKPANEGVLVFHVHQEVFKKFSQQNNARYNYSGDHFRVYEDKNGVLWVNMKGGGFGYYHPEADAVEYFYNNPASGNRRFSNIVNSVFYDPDGLLWLRTDERGIEKITFQPEDFRQQVLVTSGMYPSDNEVRGLLEDRKHRLWLGMKSGRLYIRSNGADANVHFDNMPAQGPGQVYTIMQDKAGCIWMGTKAHGLYRATPVNAAETAYHLEHWGADARDAKAISSNEIYTLLQDSRGRIWAGSFDSGLNLIQQENGKVYFIHDSGMLAKYPEGRHRKIRHIAEDQNGCLWLATTDGLLIMKAGERGAVEYATWQKLPGDAHSLGNNNVQYVFRDSRQQMWLATMGGGLNKAITDDPLHALHFDVYTVKQGLPNDYLLSCTEDSFGYLWIATQTGLSRLDKNTMKFRNYNSNDGLPMFAFSEASCELLDNGYMVFGTIRGFIEVNPAALKEHPIDVQLAFTRLQINNETVVPGTAGSVLPAALNYTTAIQLGYDENTIGVDFSIPDYRTGSRPVFAYRLQGFEDNWNQTAEGRAVYTHLPPGNYLLEVKSANAALYRQQPVRTLAITILPPFWKTWWAYLLYLILLGVAGFFLWKTAITMLRLRQRLALEKRIAALKLDFFTNVSHELRTPLTLILNPADALGRSEVLTEQGRQYVEVIKRNAQRMNRFVNQLLELRKLESGKAKLQLSQVVPAELVHAVVACFGEVLKEKKIALRVDGGAEGLTVWWDADKMETALYNVVANACKYTPEGRSIAVTIRRQDKKIEIAVEDEGTGVQPEELPFLFDLFYEGKNSATSTAKGTGIGLALTKEITGLHNGTIQAALNPAGGLTVTLVLPELPAAALTAEFTPKQPLSAVTAGLKEEESAATVTVAETGTGGQRPELPMVLLVEDNTDLRLFIQSLLLQDYRVALAENGREGGRLAAELMPDLIISDIMMPEVNGIEMLDALKKEMLTSHIPVILLTAKTAVESQIEGLEYGADYYISKPFNNSFLLAAVKNLIRQRSLLLKNLLSGKENLRLEPGEVQVTSQDARFLKEVMEVVEKNMENEEFDIETVAASVGMGRTTFYRKFKGLTGMAPVEFIRDMRLQRAQQYFNSGYGNVSEVAYAVGFGNVKYFSTCFKAKYHVAPTDYLKQKTDL